MTKTLKYEVKMTGYSLLLAAYRATGCTAVDILYNNLSY